MSTPEPAQREPTHSPEEAVRWFAQWHLYRSIVDADWMSHRGIFSAVRTWVLQRYPGPFTMLDLGCGDAGFIKSTFDATGLWAYTGVDASRTALAKARGELAGARFQVHLVEADMLDALRKPPGASGDVFNVVLASYAVHHLPLREKQEFFRLARTKLSPGGSLLFADVFRRAGETREQYLESYIGMMRRDWAGMPAESLESTIDHVASRDFPETEEDVSRMAREAGFCDEPHQLVRDATGFHRLLAFTTGAQA